MGPSEETPLNDAQNPPPAAPTPPAAPAAPKGPDAPDKEKMEAIRRRRLERLGGPPVAKNNNSTDSGSGSKDASTEPPQVSETTTPMDIDESPRIKPQGTSEQRAEKLQAAAATKAPSSTPKINITNAKAPLKRAREASDGSTGTPIRKPVAIEEEESQEAFENRLISTVFRITVDEDSRTDSNGHRLIPLSDLRQELIDNSEPLQLSVSNLDGALMEACTKVPHNKFVLDYLLPCWKRIIKMSRTLRSQSAEKRFVIKEAQRLCMSNCIFALTMPELFGREEHAVKDQLATHLVLEPDNDRGICPDWLTDCVQRWDDDDGIKFMFQGAVRQLSKDLSKMSMNDNYKPIIVAMKNLTRFNVITVAIATMDDFHVPYSAANIEKLSILGPFFRLSPLNRHIYDTYFPAPKTLDRGRIATAQTALRMSLNTHQKDLLDIINQFIRASDVSRERTLSWFGYIMNSNKKRRAMRVDEREISSDGFMMNLTVILDCLCEPFMDSTFSKVGKIDKDYFLKKPRIEINDETKLNADEKTSNAFYEDKSIDGKPNFITEVFFLTLAAHHYGSETLNSRMKSLDRQIKQMMAQLVEFEAMRATHAANPASMRILEANLARYNDAIEKSMQLKMTIEGVLFDDLMQARSLTFMRYVIVFMLRVASGSDYIPGKEFRLPLPDQQPEVFKKYPEYMLDDVVQNANFIFRWANNDIVPKFDPANTFLSYLPKVMISSQVDELVIFCITFLRNAEYIKNPALKQGLVSLLYHGTVPVYHKAKGVLGDALTSDEFATSNLLHSLMKFYIEIEFSGNFYDKFNIRYEIFQIFKCIWTNPIYKSNLEKESQVNTDFFIQYVNLLLNDTTYLLDECLSKFPKIHELQLALDPMGTQLAALTDEEKKAKVSELQKLEGQATSYMQLANETIRMMAVFTQTLSTAFTMPEIVQRLADMLDYNLSTLVGAKSSNLKVQNAHKYQFHPRQLLVEITSIYLNLAGQENFIAAIAQDGRSYKPEIFKAAERILSRQGLKSPEEIDAWRSLYKRVAAKKEQDELDEADLGDIPDEFIDPLMATLMEDPVILPFGGQVVDRKTIRTHLLGENRDPFNRQPLKIEEVIENPELKAKIEAWKKEKLEEMKRQRKQEEVDAAIGKARGDEPMADAPAHAAETKEEQVREAIDKVRNQELVMGDTSAPTAVETKKAEVDTAVARARDREDDTMGDAPAPSTSVAATNAPANDAPAAERTDEAGEDRMDTSP